MARSDEIVKVVNARLGFEKSYGIANLITKTLKSGEVTIPYVSVEEQVQIDDVYGSQVYHRILSESSENDYENGKGSAWLINQSYNFRTVVFKKGIKASSLGDLVKKSIELSLTAPQMLALKLRSYRVNISGVIQDGVWDDEFSGVKNKIQNEDALIAVEWSAELTYFSSCQDFNCIEI